MSSSPICHKICRVVLIGTCIAWRPFSLSALDPNRTFDQYIVTRWSWRDAFPGGAVNALAQTPDGFLWIGAENGLVRFDGIAFRLVDRSSSPSLPPGHVLGLDVDAEGVLWVRMQSPHLMRFRGGRFEQMFPAIVPSPFSSARERGATAVARGNRGDILIAPPDGPLRYAGGKFLPVVSTGEAAGLPISIAETADGIVWVGMRDTGLFRVLGGQGSQVGLPDQKVNVLLPIRGPELWIGTDSGLVRWDGSTITRRGVPSALARSPILAMAHDRDSNVWVSTPSGITRMSASGATLQWPGESLPGAVHAILEDREGNVWFGGTKGLLQSRDAPFMTYPGVAGEGATLYAGTSGAVWAAPTSGGLIRIWGTESQYIKGLGLDNDVIYSISGRHGEIWLGRRHGGLTHLKEVSGLLQTRTYTSQDGLSPGPISAVHHGRDGTVWAGALSGAINRIDNGRITSFSTGDSVSGDAVTTILETPDEAIWVGTASGLAGFRGGKWRRYGGDDGLPPGRVNSLTLDGAGVLWIASSSGLFYWSGTRIEGVQNAPPSLRGEIYGLAADESGNLWVSTERQVISLPSAELRGQPKTPGAVREFGMADGLPSTRGIRRDHSVAKDSSGRIWFSLQGGLCVANPAFRSALMRAPVTVESVSVDGHPLSLLQFARYPSNRHRVAFSFVGVSLTVPGRVRYRYRLDGHDSDWSQPTESREAAYTSLPPAQYTFRVMASNSEGLWNGPAQTISLEVEPQLSETWWFRLIGLCFTLTLIYCAFHYRVARIQADVNLRFQERLAERTRIARELHDTLMQSFQGLLLRLQVVDDLLPPGKAKEQLELSLERADQAIAEGRNALYDLRSSAVTTNDLAHAVRALGEELATQDSTDFNLVVEGQTRDLHPLVRDELYRITREALRNAFQHAAARQVETEITYGERAFRLRIRDDGKGIPREVLEAGRPGHYGLSGMRERARQIGAGLEIWSRPRAGTEIELSIAGSIAYRIPGSGASSRLFRWKAG